MGNEGAATDTIIMNLEILQKIFLNIILYGHSRYPSNLIFNEVAVLYICQNYVDTLMSRKKIVNRNNFCLGNKFDNILPNQIRNAEILYSFNKYTKAYLFLGDRRLVRYFF